MGQFDSIRTEEHYLGVVGKAGIAQCGMGFGDHCAAANLHDVSFRLPSARVDGMSPIPNTCRGSEHGGRSQGAN